VVGQTKDLSKKLARGAFALWEFPSKFERV